VSMQILVTVLCLMFRSAFNTDMLACSPMGLRQAARGSLSLFHVTKTKFVPKCSSFLRQSSTFLYVPDVAPAGLGKFIQDIFSN